MTLNQQAKSAVDGSQHASGRTAGPSPNRHWPNTGMAFRQVKKHPKQPDYTGTVNVHLTGDCGSCGAGVALDSDFAVHIWRNQTKATKKETLNFNLHPRERRRGATPPPLRQTIITEITRRGKLDWTVRELQLAGLRNHPASEIKDEIEAMKAEGLARPISRGRVDTVAFHWITWEERLRRFWSQVAEIDKGAVEAVLGSGLFDWLFRSPPPPPVSSPPPPPVSSFPRPKLTWKTDMVTAS